MGPSRNRFARKRYDCRSARLGCIAVLSCASAHAQDAAVELPNIDVTSSRLVTTVPRAPARERVPQVSRQSIPAFAGTGLAQTA